MVEDAAIEELITLSDAELKRLAFVPWQYSGADVAPLRDADGFPIISSGKSTFPRDRGALQKLCWEKFWDSPQVNTSIRGIVGRITGLGFETSSEIPEIRQVIEEIEEDPRNRLYNFWPKYLIRSRIEGELFLCFTCHADGFIEIDFIDPATLQGGENGDGVIYHPRKTSMPLAYLLKYDDDLDEEEVVLSIFCARYPELVAEAAKHKDFKKSKVARSRRRVFAKLKGYYRFMVSWDLGVITRRNVSHLRTILKWLNQYEELKEYEIDHKKSAGAYLWVVTIEDPKTFRLWLTLSDEEKRKTGIMAKKTPGGTMVLPPGMKIQAINPSLPNITDSDTDILHLVTSGLNEPEDVTTGQAKGTYASIKASRGPMSDRISDEVAYFDRFYRHDFYGSIFYLKSQIAGFPLTFGVEEAVDFKNKKANIKTVQKRPEKLLEVSYPTTEMADVESRARGFLGVKHGSTNDTLGIPNREIARKLGIGNYHDARLQHETEKAKYPDLIPTIDAESFQERTETEPSRRGRQEEEVDE